VEDIRNMMFICLTVDEFPLHGNSCGLPFTYWHSHLDHIAFRAVALVALVFFYNASFAEMVNPVSNTDAIRSLAIIVALIATHDLTHYLLPQTERRKLNWLARGIVLFAVIAILLLFTVPTGDNCDLTAAWLTHPSLAGHRYIQAAGLPHPLQPLLIKCRETQNIVFYGAVPLLPAR
jgi:drug/metabolite transporter (DMT)-like permease